MTNTRLYLFKYRIDSEIYYYGFRQDGYMGVVRDTKELNMNVIHMLYDGNDESDISVISIEIKQHYKLVGKIISDIVANNIYDKCDVYDNNAIFFGSMLSSHYVNVSFIHEDFVITNSKGYRYYIKGLISTIVYCSTSSDSIFIRGFKGARTKATYIDVKYRYKHSHLSSGMSQCNYCLGMSELNDMQVRNITINELDILYDLMVLDSFVKWESLEGGPYIPINHLFYLDSISESNNSVIITEELIDKLDIKLSYSSSSRMFVSKVDASLSLTPIDVINDIDDIYTYRESNTSGTTRNWIIENYMKGTDFELDALYYFKGIKAIEKVAFTENEVNDMINSMFVRKSPNMDSISNIINTTINNEVFRPTCSQEAV
jgi:hypothetical protein